MHMDTNSIGKVNILYQSSDVYAPVMGVSITSLLENNKNLDNISIYILDGGISEDNKKRLHLLGQDYCQKITFIDGKEIDDMLEKKGVKKWRNSYAMYYKLYAIDLIGKDIDRLLAIDADTIVNDEIKTLYSIDLDNNILGMVQDVMPASYMEKIGMSSAEVYYNTGMVLFDVRKWKEEKCIELIDRFFEGNLDNILFADQDALSILFQTKTKKLPLKYNYFALLSSLRECLRIDINGLYKLSSFEKLHEYYSREEILASEKDAVIYHYTGGTVVGRPWERGDQQYSLSELWEHYKEISLWNDMEKQPSHETRFHRIEKKLNSILPSPLFFVIYKTAFGLYWNRIMKIRPNN